MRPNSASTPVAYTTPTPSPALTMVPMNARSVESVRPASALTGRSDFSDAVDSPVKMLSLHSSPLTSISRMSAGTVSPSANRIPSPRPRSMTSTLVTRPSRRTTAVWCTAECSAAEASSARYSLTKPKPMLAARMTPMMIACLLSPRKNETTAVAANSPSTALRNWRPSTAIALTRWVRTELGPYRSNRADASAPDNPSAVVSSHRSTSASGAEEIRAAVNASILTEAGGLVAPDNWGELFVCMNGLRGCGVGRLSGRGEQHLQCPGVGGVAEAVVGGLELVEGESVG